jgi:hypothetical protein
MDATQPINFNFYDDITISTIPRGDLKNDNPKVYNTENDVDTEKEVWFLASETVEQFLLSTA